MDIQISRLPHDTMLKALIQMFADVRWVGFLPPDVFAVKEALDMGNFHQASSNLLQPFVIEHKKFF